MTGTVGTFWSVLTLFAFPQPERNPADARINESAAFAMTGCVDFVCFRRFVDSLGLQVEFVGSTLGILMV
jgi:hypothetical protein